MIEFPLISIVNSAQSSPLSPVQALSPLTTATTVPPSLLSLPVGTFLTGVIQGRDSKGNAILKISGGSELLLKSTVFLQNGTEVVLRVEDTGDNFKAKIVTVDGKSLSQLSQAFQHADDSVQVNKNLLNTTQVQHNALPHAQAQTKVSPAASPEPISTLRVVLLRPSENIKVILNDVNPTFAPTLEKLVSSFQGFIARVVKLELPQVQPPATPAAQPVKDSVAGILEHSTPLSTPSQKTVQPSSPSPSSPLSSFLPLPEFTSHNQFEAKITGYLKTGEATVQAPFGTLKIALPQALPVGSTLTLELPPESTAKAIVNAVPDLDVATSTGSHGWPALQKVLEVLATIDPVLASEVLQRTVPHTGERMATTTLFFLSALKGGTVSKWLGDKTLEVMEEHGHGELVKKLSGEFSMLRAQLLESPSPNWQSFIFPLFHEKELQQARLFIKRDGKEDNAGAGEKSVGTRFVVEVGLSQLGPMQMDGLVRKQSGRIQFDLIVRSHASLAASMQNDINHIFKEASDITGFKGTLQFQAARHFPVNPLEEVLASPPNPIIA